MDLNKTHSLVTLIEKDIKNSFSIDQWDNFIVEDLKTFRLTYNRIFLIESGHGTLFIDDMSYSISANEMFLIGKGQVFSFAPYSLLNGYELCFGDCFWEKAPASANNCKAVLYNNISSNRHLPIRYDHFHEFSSIFQVLFLEYSGAEYSNKIDALAAYLKIIMIKTGNLNASLTKAFNNHEHQLYGRFVELVNQQYQQTHEVSDFAEQLNISPRKLAEVCKLHSDKSPKEIINAQIITEAKRALQFSSKPVKEIAFGLNFATPEQFSHFFKRHTHISPQFYRSGFVKIGM